MKGLLDTSVFVGREQGRDLGDLPEEGLVSVITTAELRIGVLVAADPRTRARRLRTLQAVEAVEPLPVDDAVGREFAEIVAESRRGGRKPKLLDALIAATAKAHDLPIYTQDADFKAIPNLEVVMI